METLVLRLIFPLAAAVPLPVLYLLAYPLGWLLLLLHTNQRRITEINIRKCFPELTPEQRSKLTQQSLVEFAKTTLEMPKIWMAKKRDILSLVKDTTGEELLRDSLKNKQGVMILVPHLGSWELIGQYCSSKYPMTSMYRPQRSANMDAFILDARTRFDAQLVTSTNTGVKALLKRLQAGELVAILPDQNPGIGTGVFAPFFGVQANTPVLPTRLAQKTNALVLVAYAKRLHWGCGFCLHFEPTDAGLLDKDAESAAACMNAEMEKAIRECPQQYWWSHNRFRHRPEGEPPIY